MTKEFLKQEKWTIVLFLLAMLTGYITSVFFIGGPATLSGPMGLLVGFLLLELWNYHQFKKEWKFKKRDKMYW